MGGERGQVTMFVLLGLVLLLVAGLLYLVAGAQRDARSLQERVEGTIALSDMALIDRHVGSCLDAIVKDELRIVGDTGALAKNGPSAIVGSGDAQRRVGYGVTRNAAAGDTDVLPKSSAPPRYPDWGVGIENSTTDPVTGRVFPAHSGGYFGDVQFPAACDRDGPNRPGAIITCASYPGTPPGTSGPSVQETLARNVAQRVAACASPRVFGDAIGRDVTQVGDSIVNLTFIPGGLTVALEYPLELDGDIVLMTAPVSRAYDVRLLNILQFAADLAREESRNVTFRIDVDYRNLSSWKPGFEVRRTRDVAVTNRLPGGNDPGADLALIIDTASVIDGSAFTFRFLIEHRQPMLAPFSRDELLRVFRDCADCEPPSAPVAADPDDGLIYFGDPRITVSTFLPGALPGSPEATIQVVVWDADCSTPYNGGDCSQQSSDRYGNYDYATA